MVEHDITVLKAVAAKLTAIEGQVGSIQHPSSMMEALAAELAALKRRLGFPPGFTGSPTNLYTFVKNTCEKVSVEVPQPLSLNGLEENTPSSYHC